MNKDIKYKKLSTAPLYVLQDLTNKIINQLDFEKIYTKEMLDIIKFFLKEGVCQRQTHLELIKLIRNQLKPIKSICGTIDYILNKEGYKFDIK